jgi:hypothetical protein
LVPGARAATGLKKADGADSEFALEAGYRDDPIDWIEL